MIQMRTLLYLTLAASLASLALALISQYGFGLTPCHLCIAQRVPYALVIVLVLVGLAKPRYQVWICLMIAAAFLVDSGIAAYHTAVEQHWVEGPSSCTTGEAALVQSVDDFLKKIQSAPVVACDQPQWEFHGITMAFMNAVWAFLLALATFIALKRSRRREQSNA